MHFTKKYKGGNCTHSILYLNLKKKKTLLEFDEKTYSMQCNFVLFSV